MDTSPPPQRRLRLAIVAVLLAASLAACGGDGDSSRSATPDVPTDAGYDTPTSAPTSTSTPEYSPSQGEFAAYLREVAPLGRRLDRIGSHLNRVRGTDSAAYAARIAVMRDDLPALRRLLADLAGIPVLDTDLLRLHGVLLTAVTAQVSGYRLWVRADRLHAVSLRERAQDRLATVRDSRKQYDAAMRELSGLSGNA